MTVLEGLLSLHLAMRALHQIGPLTLMTHKDFPHFFQLNRSFFVYLPDANTVFSSLRFRSCSFMKCTLEKKPTTLAQLAPWASFVRSFLLCLTAEALLSSTWLIADRSRDKVSIQNLSLHCTFLSLILQVIPTEKTFDVLYNGKKRMIFLRLQSSDVNLCQTVTKISLQLMGNTHTEKTRRRLTK